MWLTILLPILLELWSECRKDRDKAEIFEGLVSPGAVEKLMFRRAARVAAERAGWLKGLNGKKRRRLLKKGRSELREELASHSQASLALMCDGLEARRIVAG